MGKKKPKKPMPMKPCYGLILALMLAGATFPLQAASMPRAGDMALGAATAWTNTLPEPDSCPTTYPFKASVGGAFEMWSDINHSYQAGVGLTADGYHPSAYSASAWHLPFGHGAAGFAGAGLAIANGTGIMAQAAGGFEFYPGKKGWVQLRGTYNYALQDEEQRGSAGVGMAIGAKW